MRLRITILLMILLSVINVSGQQDSLFVLRGRVLCEGKAVPYATLRLQGKSAGVQCNDVGEYLFKVPVAYAHDTVLVQSLGYMVQKLTVERLHRKPDVHLRKQSFELNAVVVKDYASAYHLLLAVEENFYRNYHQQTAWSTFFYRNWRAVDGELFLFDDAVMLVRRCPYSLYSDKRGYQFKTGEREMESNLKTVLRHRLVVCDHELLESKIIKSRGCDQMLGYSDDEEFFDPVATPQASIPLSSRMLRYHHFEPIRTFTSDGEDYYLVRSFFSRDNRKSGVTYEYTIRKCDLAIVRLTSTARQYRHRAPTDPWVNWYFNHLVMEADSSLWTYDVHDGHYTLTRYRNAKSYHLESSGNGHDGEVQRWMECHEWVLTDFSVRPPEIKENPLSATPQLLPGAFGSSDYDYDFWGHNNAIPVDSLPLQLLKQKLNKL